MDIYTIQRVFQYDYIYIDSIFLIIWLGILFWNKKYKALAFGIIIAPIIYFIDAHIWWNTQAGPLFSMNTFIREYWVGGIQIPHPLESYFWRKFGADFMMTASYALYAFPWIWICFKNLKSNKFISSVKYTAVWIVFWFTVPLLSVILHIDDTLVQSVRHMNSQYIWWVINFIIAFGLLFIIYRKNFSTVFKLFLIGAIGSLIMELPLYIFHIRPMTPSVLVFDVIFMLNQGVPWLFLAFDKIIPFLFKKTQTQ